MTWRADEHEPQPDRDHRLRKVRRPLTKRITLAASGSLHSVMSAGWARRIRFDTLDGFVACLAALGPNEAIALGSLHDQLPERVEVATKHGLAGLNGRAALNIIARTGSHHS